MEKQQLRKKEGKNTKQGKKPYTKKYVKNAHMYTQTEIHVFKHERSNANNKQFQQWTESRSKRERDNNKAAATTTEYK